MKKNYPHAHGEIQADCYCARHLRFAYPFIIFIIPFLIGCASQVRHVRPSHTAKHGKPSAKDEEGTKALQIGKIEDSELKKIVDSYIGVPYRYGGTTRKGMDCSGFTWRVFTRLGYKNFPRTSSANLHKLGKRVSLRDAKPGDLVFFKKWGRVFHVGIYMGNKIFAHASSKKGITYTSLEDEYFGKRFNDIRRIE
jgi:cell wall-associated NlpC family hydrolase